MTVTYKCNVCGIQESIPIDPTGNMSDESEIQTDGHRLAIITVDFLTTRRPRKFKGSHSHNMCRECCQREQERLKPVRIAERDLESAKGLAWAKEVLSQCRLAEELEVIGKNMFHGADPKHRKNAGYLAQALKATANP